MCSIPPSLEASVIKYMRLCLIRIDYQLKMAVLDIREVDSINSKTEV